MDMFVTSSAISGWKQSWESDRQQSLTWDCEFESDCIYASFIQQNQCDDKTIFLTSILICPAALIGVLIDDSWFYW